MAARVGSRLRASAYSGRTVTLKLRRYDFTTLTRSQTLPHPTDDPRVIASIAARLLAEAGTQGGLRLLGVGVSGLSLYAQDDLLAEPGDQVGRVATLAVHLDPADRRARVLAESGRRHPHLEVGVEGVGARRGRQRRARAAGPASGQGLGHGGASPPPAPGGPWRGRASGAHL